MIAHRLPEYIRSYNATEFVAAEVRQFLARTGAATLHIEPGSPSENGSCESFHSRLRDRLISGVTCASPKETAGVTNAA
jgi:putative transposase